MHINNKLITNKHIIVSIELADHFHKKELSSQPNL